MPVAEIASVAVNVVRGAEAVAAIPAAAEVATAVAPAAAVAQGLEAGLSTPGITLQHLSEINANLASNFPTAELKGVENSIALGDKASEIPSISAIPAEGGAGANGKSTPEVVASEKAPTSAEKSRDPTDKTVEAGEQSDSVRSSQVEEEGVIEKDGYLERVMKDWDKENVAPPEGDKKAYEQWLDKRADAIVNAESELLLDTQMKDWETEHPRPDKEKDPNGFNKWNKERSERKNELKAESESKKGEKNEQAKEKLSEAEVAKMVKRLKELKVQQIALIDAIQVLQIRPDKTDQNKIDLARFNVDKNKVDSEIQVIQSRLGQEITKASPLKKIAIIAAIAAVSLGSIAMSEGRK